MALASRTAKDKDAKAPAKEKATKKTPDVQEPEVQTPEPETTQEAATPAVIDNKPGGVPATFGAQFQLALGEYKNQIPPVSFGTLPRVVASQGSLVCEGETMGKTGIVSILSFNDSFAITPNENNAESSYCKFSYDNEYLNDGSGVLVSDHLKYLREEGFKDAAAKRYVELVCMLEDCDEDHDEIGNMVQVSLSPQSVKQFERYQLGCTIKIKQGKVKPEDLSQVKLTAKTKTFGSNTFTLISFSQA